MSMSFSGLGAFNVTFTSSNGDNTVTLPTGSHFADGDAYVVVPDTQGTDTGHVKSKGQLSFVWAGSAAVSVTVWIVPVDAPSKTGVN